MKERGFMEVEKMIDLLDNRYKFSIVSARRARLLNDGAEKKIETTTKKNPTIAIMEVAANKIKFK